MLCACSGEQLQLEEAPESPQSLATRDFSVSGLSAKTGDWESKFDDSQVDDVESTLKETLSLNYEEARALLGRLEYQRGNFDAALQVFQGIDICGLRPMIVKAIAERTRPRRTRSKVQILLVNTMSIHSVNLILEAVFLKSKSLEGIGRAKDAAMECKTILDMVESAWPHGMPEHIGDISKLKDIFHRALELLPELWKEAGFLDEAIAAYRRALLKPWNLDPRRLAGIQKNLAAILLYGGVEATLPQQLQQVWGCATPTNNAEEAVLLLLLLMRKVVLHELSWDPEIMDHLTFALSLSGKFETLACHVEEMMPGFSSRAERWYVLALCYSAAGQVDVALNLMRKALGHSERKHKPHLPSCLLGAQVCCKSSAHASEGAGYAMRALDLCRNEGNHFIGLAYHLLGVCYGTSARVSISDFQRERLQKESLASLNLAASFERNDPEILYNLGMENAIQRNLSAAIENVTKYLELVAGSSVNGWKLLVLVVSAEQRMNNAETITDLAVDETDGVDQMNFLRLKALLQTSQQHPRQAIETYRTLLAMIQSRREEHQPWIPMLKVKKLEMEAWLDLGAIYRELESWANSNICLDKAKSVEFFSPKVWHARGLLYQAQSLNKEALVAFSTSLSITPDYVPSMVSIAAIVRMLGGKSLPIARSILMNALCLEKTNHNAWLNLGQISKMEGDLPQAADCFQAAHELKQSSPIENFI